MEHFDEFEDEWAEIARSMKHITSAKSEPSPNCIEDKQHNFKAIMHSDNKGSYAWFYKCDHCGEFLKSETKRNGEDAAYWAD